MRGRVKRISASRPPALCAARRILQIVCLGFAALCLPSPCAAESLAASVRALLANQSPRPFNGVVLIARGDSPPIVVAQGVRPESRFVIGSLSKQMTAALILRAVEGGRIALDAPLSIALPDLKDDWAPRVTTRQLLTHTSGVDVRGKPLRAAPGSAFSYSNGGYDLLGEMLERTGGEPLSKQFGAIFARCGMSGAGVVGDAGSDPVPGFSETEDGRLLPASPTTQAGYAASGGVVAIATDLLRWTQCLYGGRVISGASLRAMTQPGATREHRWGQLGYGYGLQIDDTPLGVEYSHSGYVPGYQSMLIYYPGDQTTLVVLENISWSTGNAGRAFHYHDALRRLLFEASVHHSVK